MVRGKRPGEFEQVVLLTLAGFRSDATGREVYERLTETTGREVSLAAVHITLQRLHEKGWARCHTSAPAASEGGKPRRRYALGPDGARMLGDLREQFDRLWGEASVHPLLADDRG
ncbi:MAG: PadR family transcriptional regulator [Gemmatimonadota bacterium]